MNASDDHNLNDCGCCEGVSTETPALVFNRPGLAALAYRVGAHSQFKETMLARLSGSRQPALQGLNTRSDDDFSIALLDAWATIADVLTFYQERVANESYLRTATERLSILELARLIGYELRPGVAAGTYLAFTLEDAPGAFGQAINLSNIAQGVPEIPPPIVIGPGVKAQSVPAPGEQAQTFETVEEIEARVEWNAIKPRLRQPQKLSKTMGSVALQGAATNLKPGDKILIDASDGRAVRTVFNISVDDAAGTTRVDFETPALSPAVYNRPTGLAAGASTDFPAQTPLTASVAESIIAKSWSEEDLAALAEMQNWPLASLTTNIVNQTSSVKFTDGAGVLAFRQRAAIFGHNAQDWKTLPLAMRVGELDPTPKESPGIFIQEIKDLAMPFAESIAASVGPFVEEVGRQAELASGQILASARIATGEIEAANQRIAGMVKTDADKFVTDVNTWVTQTVGFVNQSLQDFGRFAEARNLLFRPPNEGGPDIEGAKARLQGGAGQVLTAPILAASAATLAAGVSSWAQLLKEETWVALTNLSGIANSSIRFVDSVGATAAAFAANIGGEPALALREGIATATNKLISDFQQSADSFLRTVDEAAASFIKGVYADRQNSWADATFTAGTDIINLDAVYPQIIPQSWIALSSPTDLGIYSVLAVAEETKSDFNLSVKTTRLNISNASGQQIEKFSPRQTTVYAQSEQLVVAEAPIADIAQGADMTLDRPYLGLKKGQKIVLTGERDDLRGVIESELLIIKEVVIEAGFTFVTFENSLAHPYVRQTVTINANVAQATHGETVQETLGSGDATLAFQRFTLRQPPLTFVGAATPSGAATTLEVRVNDLLWKEADDFFGHGPDERIYITETADDGKTTVIFGDGKTGARLPTGVENVKAKYRKGIGLGGLVKAHQISQLMTKPLGVKAATNPFASEAAQDPERLDDARRNAPLTVLTLGRVVSLQDYEDFARAFSGVAKALATWSWNGERRCVLLTVAGMLGAVIEKTSDLYKDLLAALRSFGDPHAPLLVESYAPRVFRLAAQLQIAPDYLPEVVSAAVETELREHYSFDAREFGQPVHLSEVIGLVQNVPGVVSVTVTEFYRPDLDSTPVVLQHLPAARPRLDGATMIAAELLTLDARPIQLTTQLFVDSEAAQ